MRQINCGNENQELASNRRQVSTLAPTGGGVNKKRTFNPMLLDMRRAPKCHARSKGAGLQTGGAPTGNRNALKHGARSAEALALKRPGRGPSPDGSRELSGTVVGTLSTRIISQPRAEKSGPEKQKFGRSKQNAPTSVCYSTWFRKTADHAPGGGAVPRWPDGASGQPGRRRGDAALAATQ